MASGPDLSGTEGAVDPVKFREVVGGDVVSRGDLLPSLGGIGNEVSDTTERGKSGFLYFPTSMLGEGCWSCVKEEGCSKLPIQLADCTRGGRPFGGRHLGLGGNGGNVEGERGGRSGKSLHELVVGLGGIGGCWTGSSEVGEEGSLLMLLELFLCDSGSGSSSNDN